MGREVRAGSCCCLIERRHPASNEPKRTDDCWLKYHGAQSHRRANLSSTSGRSGIVSNEIAHLNDYLDAGDWRFSAAARNCWKLSVAASVYCPTSIK